MIATSVASLNQKWSLCGLSNRKMMRPSMRTACSDAPWESHQHKHIKTNSYIYEIPHTRIDDVTLKVLISFRCKCSNHIGSHFLWKSGWQCCLCECRGTLVCIVLRNNRRDQLVSGRRSCCLVFEAPSDAVVWNTMKEVWHDTGTPPPATTLASHT
eukprot:4710724-Amphidinium_carterae.2